MRAIAAVVLAAGILPSAGSRRPIQDVAFNDNRQPAGRMVDGTLHADLVIGRGRWEPLGPGNGFGDLAFFRETGHAPTNPGPLLRVREGTPIRATVHNETTDTMVVHGLASRRQAVPDSLVLAPGATDTASFVADAEGSYYYWAAVAGTAFADRVYDDSQLNGALIVDPAVGTPSTDRVFVISWWVQTKTPGGDPDVAQEIFAVNGRPWPHTERLTYAVGDSVRWRVINASADVHPLHLHGFYFRVDARGDAARDTTYWPAERRMAVTELALPGTTMRIAFQPDRPGGWVFHCHLNWHVVSNPGVGAFRTTTPQREAEVEAPHDGHDADHHVERGMGGLMMALQVIPPPDYAVQRVGRRTLVLHVHEQPVPLPAGQPRPRYAYVLQEGEAPPAPDSLPPLASTLVLRRGEPTTIRVVNHTSHSTQVHWHGLELESPYDGVVGVGGLPAMPTRAIPPGGSSEVHITPPRAGSFMYHTHMHEIAQMAGGLWGALVVLEPDEAWDPSRDHVFQLGEGLEFSTVLNGREEHPPRTLRSGTPYRFRLMNIAMGAPTFEYSLVRDGAPVEWTILAKDGFDRPAIGREPVRARQRVSIGETYDMEVSLPPGDYALEVRRGNGTRHSTVPLRVLGWLEPAAQVASAVLPLPAEFRDGATVMGYRVLEGALEVLRAGTNGLVCLADDPALAPFHVACYHEALEPFMARGRALRATGLDAAAVDSARYAEIDAGTLPLPRTAMALWQLTGPPDAWDAAGGTVTGARPLHVVYLPYATSESTGIPSVPALGTPWLMLPGTPKAHIMFVPRM